MPDGQVDGRHPSQDTPQSNLADLTGMTLGKYRLVEKLGQGGMAQVYKAYQPDLDRYVALKVLHPHLTTDEEFVARFCAEARTIAALEHPHIVHLHDFDTRNGLAFLVMEYLTGTSLKACLRELNLQHARMEPAEAVRILAALADALDHAHRHGVVHRDVKPSNVIITSQGRPVLTDFGIARMVDATAVTTHSDGTLGTPAYMSPEQGRGEPGDARSDIYALGVVMYQLCTGQLPFDADTPYALILKHLTAPLPPPRAVCPDLPEALERIMLKALAKEPADRFQTAGEMAKALRESTETRARSARAVTPDPHSGRAQQSSRSKYEHELQRLGPAALLVLVGLVVALVAAPALFGRYLPGHLSTAENGVSTLISQGPSAVEDTWLDPDTPDQLWHDAEYGHLQGALKPDRIVIACAITRLPPAATIVSATLSLRVQALSNPAYTGKIAAFQLLRPWRASIATYNAPWSEPGLYAGRDYDRAPLDIVALPDDGWATINITNAVRAWYERSRIGGGIVLMLSDDSERRAHYHVYLTDHSDPESRPIFTVVYRTAQ